MPFSQLINAAPTAAEVRGIVRVNSNSANRREPLTDDEKQRIYNMRADGHTWPYIGTVMGRSSEAIRRAMIRDYGDVMRGQAKHTGIPLRDRK